MPSLADSILRRGLQHVIEQSRLGMVTAVVITSALGTLFVPTSGWALYLVWWGLAAGGFVLRQAWFERMRRNPGRLLERQLTRVTVVSAITGWVVICSLPLFGAKLSQDQFILLVGLFLAWISAGVSVLAVQPKVYLGYLVACLSTVMFSLWQRFGLSELNVMAIAVPLGGYMMYRLAVGIQGLISEAVTEGVRNEALAAQLQDALAETHAAFNTRSRFLASASHDLKQPVHALLLLVNVLRRTSNDDRRQQVVREIEHASHSIDSMFSSLMDMARIDAGSIQAHLTGVELIPLLKSSLAGYTDLCAQKGIAFSMRAEGAPVVRADPLLLQRVLANLLDNALKFTPKGGITVAVSDTTDGAIELTVRDSGLGFDEAATHQLFKPFSRGEQAQSLGVPGLGLGLAIVQHMVQLMEMRVDVASASGQGSVFTLTMARDGRSENVPMDTQESPRLQGLRVVVIEDDHLARDAMTHWLQEAGATVTALDRGEGLTPYLAKDGLPDLLIADYNLGPGRMNGAQWVAEIQIKNPRLPCIIVTGEGSADLGNASATLLRKPLSAASLARALRELLHGAG